MATLLEQARAAKVRRRADGYVYGEQDYELALALLSGEVTPGQATTAWGMSQKAGSSLYSRAFCALREAYRAGLRFRWEDDEGRPIHPRRPDARAL